jgi:hypothetical protein
MTSEAAGGHGVSALTGTEQPWASSSGAVSVMTSKNGKI